MMTDFERNIKDPSLSVVSDLSFQNRPLLMAFGGIYGALGIPPFEFYGLTKNLKVNKIYLRDLSQTWYHSGLPGISNSIDETTSFLKRTIHASEVKNVVVMGNSMGGYAAILFGILIQADIIHAFSPPTSIADEKYIRHKKKALRVKKNFPNKYFDLKNLIKSNNYYGSIHIYYDAKDKIDSKHAMHLKRSKNIELHSFVGGGHGLIRELKDSGQLRKIITSSFNNQPNQVKDTDRKQSCSFFAKLLGARHGNR
jgi:hypothetical protein